MAKRKTTRLTRGEDDAYGDVDDAATRRRIQNRENQRKFRERKKQREMEMHPTDTAAANPEELAVRDGNITVVPPASDDHQDRDDPPGYASHQTQDSQPTPLSPFVVLQSPPGVFALGEHYHHSVNSDPITTLDPSSLNAHQLRLSTQFESNQSNQLTIDAMGMSTEPPFPDLSYFDASPSLDAPHDFFSLVDVDSPFIEIAEPTRHTKGALEKDSGSVQPMSGEKMSKEPTNWHDGFRFERLESMPWVKLSKEELVILGELKTKKISCFLDAVRLVLD